MNCSRIHLQNIVSSTLDLLSSSTWSNQSESNRWYEFEFPSVFSFCLQNPFHEDKILIEWNPLIVINWRQLSWESSLYANACKHYFSNSRAFLWNWIGYLVFYDCQTYSQACINKKWGWHRGAKIKIILRFVNIIAFMKQSECFRPNKSIRNQSYISRIKPYLVCL